jgi:hypothetical protein
MIDVVLATAEHLPNLDEDSVPLLDALRRRDLVVQPWVWTQSRDWNDVGICVIRSTWRYYDDLPGFLKWTRTVEDQTVLVNPSEVVEWNAEKTYLETLRERGVPIVSSIILRPG